jgi:outer membrane protein insertion porin family
MPRAETHVPKAPVPRPAARLRFLPTAPAWTAALALVLALAAGGGPSLAQGQAGAPKGTITEVRVEGNDGIPDAEILGKIHSKAGKPYNDSTVAEDLQRLVKTGQFSDVAPYWKPDPRRPDGVILTFRVRELPVLREVQFLGMTKLKLKDVEQSTNLKKGAPADPVKTAMATHQIERMYADKGYSWAKVELLEGGKPGDTRAVFQVYEGPKCVVSDISFVGNTFVSANVLRTKITSRPPILGVGGLYHRDEIETDAQKLREYYNSQGFFQAVVRPVVRRDGDFGEHRVEFIISEGTQFKVRNIKFEGQKRLTEAQLREGLVMHSGQPFTDALRDADIKNLQARYGALGCIDAKVAIETKYPDPEKSPGVVDLVYRVDEGVPYLLGRLIIRGNAHTMDAVIRREANMAGLVPGEPIDMQRIEKFKARVGNLRYFATGQGGPGAEGKTIEVFPTNRRPGNDPFGETNEVDLETLIGSRLGVAPGTGAGADAGLGPVAGGRPGAGVPGSGVHLQSPDAAPAARTRLQNPDGDPAPGLAPPAANVLPEPLAPGPGPAGLAPMGEAADPFAPGLDEPVPAVPPLVAPPIDLLPPPPADASPLRGAPRTPPYGSDVPPGNIPGLPGSNTSDTGPDRQEPFNERSFADIVTQVDEVATGRFMVGIGASSFQGLMGNVIINESNFDIFRFPRSASELFNGSAFRGRGQNLHIEFSPGTVMNRAMISFRDPYVANLPLAFNASGYVFNRYYPDWNEARGGGRFSFGRQFGTQWYADVAFRIEDVNMTGFKIPAPAEYLAAQGHTTLATIRPSLRLDNRNDPFSPNAGYYLEAAFEQGWATFNFPKFTIEGREYFTTGSRPDGSGKRVLTFREFYGVTGPDTPVYERFFAGDWRSLRGFAYRGVGPHVFNQNIGGLQMLLGSVEWQFPWTANDRFQQVVFCDFGSVTDDYSLNQWRVSVGTGVRIYLPQQFFGPLPLAFDLAYPVVKQDGDHTRYFTFFIGAFW